MAQTQASVGRQAHAAHRRCRYLGLPNRYRPTTAQWVVLFALGPGPLPMSMITVTGAHVDHRAAKRLAVAGLVAIDGEVAELTDRGRDRVKAGW